MIVPLSHYRKWLIPFQDEKTREFIQKAKLVHGDKYDYRFVKYLSSKEKVCIYCDNHKVLFWQTPNNHLNGQTCPVCGKDTQTKKKQRTTATFIHDASLIHNNKYDYSKVHYEKSSKEVCIICPKHGEFWQKPEVHLAGHGCSKCGIDSIKEKNSDNTDVFISKARGIHGDKYDYSKTKYVKATEKVIITCPIHGDFEQLPYNHLSGHGCTKCNRPEVHNTEDFINRSRKAHGNKYDYSKTVYSGCDKKVTITCPDHGDFEQNPNDHMDGHGCPKCGRESIAEKLSSNKENFVDRANKIHNNKYNYDKTVYKNNREKVIITCPEHGDFEQTPHGHLQGEGCPVCGQQNLCESYVGEWLSENNIEHTHLYPVPGLIRNSRRVIIDYWIKFNGKILMAEYNGDYHYRLNKYMHRDSIDNFKNQLMRDEKVKLYCKKNSITLIEIPYIFNTRQAIFDFLDKVLLQGIDPNTLVDYESLFERPSDYIPYSENENN